MKLDSKDFHKFLHKANKELKKYGKEFGKTFDKYAKDITEIVAKEGGKVIDYLKQKVNDIDSVISDMGGIENFFKLMFSIEDYGGIRLWAKNGAFGCERVEEQGRKLDALTATRILFGVSDASCIIEKGEEFEKFCPLPLSWSLQDRV